MKFSILIVADLCCCSISFSRNIYKLKTHSLLVTYDSCTAELNLENSTRNVKGFLYNKGNGRTEFRNGIIKLPGDSLYVIGSDTLKIIPNGDLVTTQTGSIDTIELFTFGTGNNNISDTALFSTSSIYQSFYNDKDTLVVTGMQIGLQGSSPLLNTKIFYNDSLNTTEGAVALVNAGTIVSDIYTGTTVSSFDNNKIPPQNWVWCSTPVVTNKPKHLSVTLTGYRKKISSATTTSDSTANAKEFIITVKTDNPGTSANNKFRIFVPEGGFLYDIETSDGQSITGLNGTYEVTFASVGTYDVKISSATPVYISFLHDAQKVLAVKHWGDLIFSKMQQSFRNCINLQVTAADKPHFAANCYIDYAFSGCTNLGLVSNPAWNTWDMHNVISMEELFGGCSHFNENITAWDVSHVTNMNQIFLYASTFNQNIRTWNTSAAVSMSRTFFFASSFNQNISTWDVSHVTTFLQMFYQSGFNQPIGPWNTSAATDMVNMFAGSAFNQDINSWDVSHVTNFQGMFLGCASFNQNLNSWNTSAATNMQEMFSNATAFNGNISSWDVSHVTTMYRMFFFSLFNQNISAWNVGNVTTMFQMFYNDVSFNQNLGSWNVSHVTDFLAMFANCTSFSQNIGSWNTSSATTMANMFAGCTSFNQNIGSWDVSHVTDFSNMFNSSIFNQDISGWDVGAGVNFESMFMFASAFNQPIGSWDMSSAVNLQRMFYTASAFNQNLNSWDVSHVTNMFQVFFNATSFAGNVSSWNTGSVINMSGLFANNYNFNSDISGWNVSHVTDMSQMFYICQIFNRNISGWDVSKLTNMDEMFRSTGTSLFNQDLSSWCVTLLTSTPTNFSTGASAWSLPKPVWGTCP